LAGGAPLPSNVVPTALLPAGIRRLTDAEYAATAMALVPGAASGITDAFIPDARQSGFTLNDAQRVDPVFAGQLASAASTLAADVRQHAAERAPCTDPKGGADACATQFIRSFGKAAYRRPVGDDEVAQLMTVFHAAYEGGSYEEGIELIARAMLQSAAFLYLTEIGDAPAKTIKLTPYELASSISYLTQGGPPSTELVDLALQGQLEGPGLVKAIDDLKLFVSDGAARRTTGVINEWLGTDTISETSKDSNVYGDFAGVKAAYEQESMQFLNMIVGQGGSLADLLGASWSVINGPLAKVYGLASPAATDMKFTQVQLSNRVGILNQGAFLSVFAHATETAPVLRGVAVMRRVACLAVAPPLNLAKAIVPPPPDPTKTTRARFAAHATSECAGCHDSIDSFGFAFEAFDGMGKYRVTEKVQGGAELPIDSTTVIKGTDFDGSYADSNALAKAMSTSPQVRECFARHVFRAYAGTSDVAVQSSEDAFVQHWLNEAPDAQIIGTITAYLTNPNFAYRRAQ